VAVEQLAPEGVEVTVYAVMTTPPFETGAVHVSVAWALPPVTLSSVGGPGIVAGVTDAVPAGPLSTPFVATTAKV